MADELDAYKPPDSGTGSEIAEATLQEESPEPLAADRTKEQIANGLIGAVSGGLLGLMVAGFLGSRFEPGLPSVAMTGIFMLGLGALVAMANLRGKQSVQPVAPRAVWGVLLTGSAVVIVLADYLFEAAYSAASGGAATVKPPLSIWPICRLLLQISLATLVCGIVAAFAGLSEISESRNRYTGKKWVALSVLASGAWMVLAFACYVAGHGFSLVL
jgi:hypothetical protein